MRKPRVFIGSSREGLPIAEALFACLANDTQPTLWTHQLFLPSRHPLEDLENQIRRYAFAVLVASPDDQVIKRGISSPAMRDNILIEFGLFTGALGRRRTFFVCPTEPRIALPSDYLGITNATYDASRVTGDASEIAAAIQVACNQIRQVIKEEWLLIEKQAEVARSWLLESERAQAIQRLHGVATKLRDVLIAVERDAFAAFSDKTEFEKVKTNAATRVYEVAESFKTDAEIARVEERLQALAVVTTAALRDLPFPGDIAEERKASRQHMEAIERGVRHLKELRNDILKAHLINFASAEVTGIVATLMDRYEEWWDRHYPKLQEVTARMQDALFLESMQLASTTEDERGRTMEQAHEDPTETEKLGIERERTQRSVKVDNGEEASGSGKPESCEAHVGVVTHYYDRISVAMVTLTGDLALDERVKFVTKRFVDLFEQDVTSMQIAHEPVESAVEGQHIGLKTTGPVTDGTLVFKTQS